MSDTTTLQGIANDAKDIFRTSIEWATIPDDQVPNYDDGGLTFETGQTKKGKKVVTAVLFVDLRNSTTLNFEQHPDQLGKLYAAFVRSMIQCAEIHGGIVRNIIGDRVMVVFPARNCCTQAVNTAITMNTVVTRILNPLFKGAEVKAGIGIDYGTMFVEKVGIPMPGKERDVYKNLVWLGRPANVASKLTDSAGKFLGNLATDNVLITERAYNNYKQESPKADMILNNRWKVQSLNIENVSERIFGSSTYWNSINQVSL